MVKPAAVLMCVTDESAPNKARPVSAGELGGSGGDASAANQQTAIAQLQIINSEGYTVADPATGTATDSASVQVVASNANRAAIAICNLSETYSLKITFKVAATQANAVYIAQPEQTLELSEKEQGAIVREQINAIASSGSVNFTYVETLRS